MEEVNKCSIAWPYFSYKILPIRIFEVNTSLKSLLISWANSFDACVDDWHPSVFLFYFIHFLYWKTSLINCEILKIIHIVDISPDCV
jgi:hypothetical protein